MVVLAGLLWPNSAGAQTASGAQVQFPLPNVNDAIHISAERASHFKQGAYDVWILRGNCTLSQGALHARSSEAVLWVDLGQPQENKPTKVITYLEGDVVIGQREGDAKNLNAGLVGKMVDSRWFGRFFTTAALQMRVPPPSEEPQPKPAVFYRGLAQLDPNAQPTGPVAQSPQPGEAGGPEPLPPTAPVQGGRRIRAFPRSAVPVQAQWFPSPGRQESVAIISAGVNLIIDGIEGGTIDIATDRAVIWTAGRQPDLSGQSLASENTPLEIYMEGNIVFRQGERVIFAKRMYYDVVRRTGIILDVELLTPVPEYQGLLRLKASAVRQLDRDHFMAYDALLTSSRLGEPRYHLGSGTIAFEDVQQPAIDPLTGTPIFNPETGHPEVEHQRFATAQNNFLYLGGVPILYWPTIATDLKDPQYYIRSVSFRDDRVFGTQVFFEFDAYQVFGIRNRPEGTRWDFSLDYLSERGPAVGTDFDYTRPNFLGYGGPAIGNFDAWGIHDTGLDNLGADRRALVPSTETRGRVLWTHRQWLENNYTLWGELGFISDDNFLEQYFEREWDERKNESTRILLRQAFDNQAWNIYVQGRINTFFTETEWLPRLDHYWIGQPLWSDRLSYFEHTSVGYGRLRVATTPTDPVDASKFQLLPWEHQVSGERIITRHELDWPLEAGPVKVVPYALGELGHWGADLDDNDIQRAYVQTGARASLPFWTADPTVENHLLNVHGLAHKVVFEAEISYSDASQSLDQFPLYDQVDDNSVEHFRRRTLFETYGLTFGDQIPLKYDERYYALRSGLGGWVTSPSLEIAEDLFAVRMGMRHRWQTKRGPVDRRHIIDWITLDTNATWFPREDEDNFGAPFGLVDYDFQWHVGDRLTFVSDGYFDFFDQGLRTISFGGFLARPPRGNVYLGFRSLEGPISANVVTASYNYWMSPKWVSSFGTSFDLSSTNIGQNFALTRVGESLLVRVGFNVDTSRDNVGLNLMIEPRFLPSSKLGSRTGAPIPPAGAYGLE